MGAHDYEDRDDEEEEEEEEEAPAAAPDDDEEEEEGQDEYEQDGFIVNEDEEEVEPDASDEETRIKKKKRKKKEVELDLEDYEMLAEHGISSRPKDKKQFKRLKKARPEAGMNMGLSDDDEDQGGRRRQEEALKYRLFGDFGAAQHEDDIGEEEEEAQQEEDVEEDEMADFIVSGDEGMDEDGQPVRTRRSKKKHAAREAEGIPSSALQEAQEIFGDVSQLLEDRRMRISTDEDGDAKNRLEKEFEPSVLEEKYMTEKDDRIRELDIAERLQPILELATGLPKMDNVGREAEWVYERLFGKLAFPQRPDPQQNKPEIIKQIASVIQLLHDQKVEVPFIAMYRKELCKDLIHEEQDPSDPAAPTLRHFKTLWAVQFWDKRWWMLQRRKVSLRAAYEKRASAAQTPEDEEFLGRVLQALSDAPSEVCIDDIDVKFNLYFPPDEIEAGEGKFKRPKRRSFYSTCRRYGIGRITRHIGLTSEQFGENILAMYKKHELENASSTPEEVASSRFGGEFSNVQAVLQGVRHMAAVEISTEPAVREFVRNIYMERAVISTKPTQEGNRVIDAFHQYADVKWLSNKPVNAFEDGQWLLIQKAEEEKLLEVTVGVAKDVANSFIQEFEHVYLSDGVSRHAQLWNEQRRHILKDALTTHLLPSMEKEIRVVLTGRAKLWVGQQCAEQLWKIVSVAPYPRPAIDQEERADDDGYARVLACCWGPGKPATVFVMLDAAGEIIDTLHTAYLTMRTGSYEQQERKKNDQQRLLKFMKDHQPHVVIVGGANLNCRYLKDDIFEVIFKIVEEHPRDLAEGIDIIQQVYGDEMIPRLYENSRVSEEQLQQQPEIIRRAVGLGRFLQNPLAVIAALCGPSREVLSLKLHALQSYLSPEETYEAVERVMVTVTNQVGIDVNMAAAHDWLFTPLQFVGGLGPRKASVMRRAIQGAGRISSRKELLTSLSLMKKNVFINCAGFMRVRASGQAASANQVLDPLEDTRIHPESYELAKKMAEDAYCEEFGDNMDDESLEMAVDHVRENPQVLKNLDIEEYVKIVQERGTAQGKKLETLFDVKLELQHGFQEWRLKYSAPTPEQVFYMLTQESEETLSEGRVVQVTVKKIQQNKVLCALESGLLGIIQREDLSDDRDADPFDKVTEGGILTCRIREVHKAKFVVDLTSKGSDLRADHWDDKRPKDPYYVQNPMYFQDEEEKAKKKIEEQKHKSFKPRMIVHPQFRNISLLEATQALAEKEIGDVIIRPSSKGPSHLSMTLKFYPGVFTHIDINEGGKDVRNMQSLLRLGKTLTIGDDTYEDLDEVIARYVDPLVSHWRDMFRYRKFKAGTKEEIDSILRTERETNPGRIPYYFSICYDHPGVFTLSYIRNISVHHEYVSVSPKGFRFRQRYFDIPDKLVAHFQKHFNDPVSEAPPRRAAAAMVPSSDPRKSSTRSGWDSGRRSGWDQGGGSAGWDRGTSGGGGGGNRRGSWNRDERGKGSGGGNWSGGYNEWSQQESDNSWGQQQQQQQQQQQWSNAGVNTGWGDSSSKQGGHW